MAGIGQNLGKGSIVANILIYAGARQNLQRNLNEYFFITKIVTIKTSEFYKVITCCIVTLQEIVQQRSKIIIINR